MKLISVDISIVLLVLFVNPIGARAAGDALITSRSADALTPASNSDVRPLADQLNAGDTQRTRYLAAGPQGETGYIRAEELIELFSPEPTMTRSIRGIGGVTTGHAEARKEFRNILFDFDSDRIKRSSDPQLGEIGKALSVVMTDHPDYRFSIEGHTDSIGDHHYNLQLSQRRAGAVKNYLVVRYGLDSRRITAVGFGEQMPVAPNETEHGRALNRRVEIVRE